MSASAAKAWAALAVALAVYAVLQIAPLRHGGNANDFKHIYAGAVMLADGANPYDAQAMLDFREAMAREDPRFANGILPYVYLPFTGIVMRPLAWMPFRKAEIAWQLVNHALLLAGLALAAAAGGLRFTWKTVALLGAAAAFNYSIFRQNNAGQLNMVLVFGSALLAFGISRGWEPRKLGLVVAFLMLFKLTPGIYLMWFVLRGISALPRVHPTDDATALPRGRATAWFSCALWTAAWAAMILFLCASHVGGDVHAAFLPVLADMGFGKSTWAQFGQTFWRDPYNQSFNAFFHHALVPWEGMRHWIDAGPAVANAATWAVALAVLGVFGWRTIKSKDGQATAPLSSSLLPHPSSFVPIPPPSSFSLAILASLLLPSILWDHYLVQALVACVLLWRGAGRPLRAAIVVAVAVWSLGVEFNGGFVHPGVFAGIGARFEIPLPGWNGPLQAAWMSLKLWPLALVFAMASRLSGNAAAPEKSGS